MAPVDVVQRYFGAWLRHDAQGIVDAFAADGTYEDPDTPEPLRGAAIGAYAESLWQAFPDLSFENAGIQVQGQAVAAEWVMRGTNTGPFRSLPPSGRSVCLRGADFITVEGDRIRSVRGYFDSRLIPQQLGLQVLVQPREAGPFTFGTAVGVGGASEATPGAFSITMIEVRSDAEEHRVRELARGAGAAMPAMPGFIGAITATIGRRMMTVAAWERPEQVRTLLGDPTHREASAEFFRREGLGAAGHTGVWVAHRLNPSWIRCTACGTMADQSAPGGLCGCGAVLPRRPRYW
jgi:steroid delta-isomerase-like uncharacterized protein